LLTPLHPQPEFLAQRLLSRFGTIGQIAQASETELRRTAVEGETWIEAFLAMRRLMHDGLREELIRSKLGQDRRALFDYLLSTMRKLPEERMIAIFADAEGFVIAEETIAEGTKGHVLVTPRRIFGRAMKLDARRILLAHNHPSGCAQPSLLDIRDTRALCRQARSLGIWIEDHLIVGHREIVSMKDRGLI
jgi:DNA repair protein RadC